MLRILAMGDLEVDIDGQRVALPPGRRLRSLLAWLAVHPGPHPRARVAAALWPDVPDANARANLRSAIWALRTDLGSSIGAHLRADRTSVELDGTDLFVDIAEFRRLVSCGRAADAVGLCRGALLADHDEEWVLVARETFDDQVSTALGSAVHTAEATGNITAAMELARRRYALRPLDESVGRDVIRLLTAAGDEPQAVATYSALAAKLRRELGIEPAGETRALVQHLSPPSSATATRLIGREAELRRLTDCWRNARAGAGSVVVLSGEGGIGKTRLAEALVSVAERDGARTAIGAPGALGGAPYEMWSEVLTDAVSTDCGLPQRAPWVPDLTRLFPALAAHIGVEPAVSMVTDPQHERIRLFESVVELLGVLARHRPTLLVFEDLHQADPSSLQLLGYAGRRIAKLSLLLVLTRRRLPARAAVDGPLGRLRARGTLRTELDLAPLRPNEIRALAHTVGSLSEAQLTQVVGIADGNPLFAVEAARHLGNGGTDPARELRAATTALLTRLTTSGRRFVELAAVAGRELHHDELATLPLLADPARAATEALGTGLLRTRDGSIGFRHDLLRLAVYDDLAESDRARLHDALATELLRHDRTGDRRRTAELARHLRRAGRYEMAAAHYREAAAAARGVAALPEASEFLREAVELAPREATTLIELAEVEALRGLLAESDHAFERAMLLTHDPSTVIAMWLRRGRWLRGGICHPRESRRSYRAALDALDRDPSADPTIRAEALAGMAWAESVAGDPQTTDALLREVAVVMRGTPHSDLLTHDIGVARGHALLRAGKFTDSYGPLIAAGAAAARAGRPDMAYSCLVNAAGAAACAGRFDRALDFVDRCVPLVVPTGLLRLVVHTHCGRAALLRRIGRYGDAAGAVEAGRAAADRLDIPALDGLVCAERGLLALATGDHAVAADELQRALDVDAPVSRPSIRLYRAEALLRAGRSADAEAELRLVVVEPVSDSDFPDTLVARMTRIQGLIAWQYDDAHRAAAHLRHAAQIWARRTANTLAGDRYAANIVDLGRPPLTTLVEPAREHATVLAELTDVQRTRATHRSDDAPIR